MSLKIIAFSIKAPCKSKSPLQRRGLGEALHPAHISTSYLGAAHTFNTAGIINITRSYY